MPQGKWSDVAARLRRRRAVAPVESANTSNQRDARLQRLESVLLLAREPFPPRKLAQFAHLADPTEARTLIRRLNELYDDEGRAFRVEEVAGGFQLLTRSHLADWVRKTGLAPSEVRLSSPAMETLAVVAYRQPVLRAEVEAIRGVACGEMLRQLMERDLVKIGGRSDELGRPYLYATTRRFLQVYGLGSLEDLPRAAALQAPLIPAGSPAKIFDEQQPDLNDSKEDATVSVTQLTDLETETTPPTATLVAPALAGEVPPVENVIEDEEDEIWGDDDDDEEEDDFDDDYDEDDLDDDDLDDEWDDDDEDLDVDDEEDDEWEEVDDDDEEWDEDDEEDDEDEDWDDEE